VIDERISSTLHLISVRASQKLLQALDQSA
jgi:hypothetical protein